MVDREILRRVLDAKATRHAEVVERLQDPAVATDPSRLKRLSRELGKLEVFARTLAAIQAAESGLIDARELAAGDDPEIRELADAEVGEQEKRLDVLWEKAEDLLAQDDELADRDCILEIRAGVGGDEAALFAGDLFNMYRHFCGTHKLRLEIIDESPGEMGGFKEIIAEVSGARAFHLLRPESGTHRVQRVPKTESQGRIHTSAATVAVLPRAEEVDVDIDWDKDVREDKMRAGGPGGQKVNKTESAIRLTHEATGISVHIQDEKSQHKNRAKARAVLAARVFDHFQRQVDAKRAAERKGMIGTGDRSQRIRTYNFPQSRITDHRIESGGTVHNLAEVLLGELSTLHERLRQEERDDRLRDLADRAERGELGDQD